MPDRSSTDHRCRRHIPLCLLAVVIVAAACSGGDGAPPDTTVPAPTTPVTTPPPSTTTGPATTTEPATTVPAAAPIRLDVITYNVAGLPEVLSDSEPSVNTAIIGPLLNDYDLVLVQESWLTPDENPTGLRTYHEVLAETSTHAYASTPLPAPLGTDRDRPTAQLSDGLNRFSVLEFDGDGVIRRRWSTCGDASADCLSLKGFSMARTTLPDGSGIDVYNLHMDAGREDAAVRAENVAELAAFINEESADRPVIVAGDFNLHLDRDPDADQLAELLDATGLVDACAQLGCPEPNRIDKILYRSGEGIDITTLE